MSDELLAITPIDGRYRALAEEAGRFFSEYALTRYRLRVEVEYLRLLCREGIAECGEAGEEALREISESFSVEEALAVKKIELETRHDVEAVVRYLKQRLSERGLSGLARLTHIGLTSEDTTNLAYSLALMEFNREVMVPLLGSLIMRLAEMGYEERSTAMLARTHGQPAVPTTIGKELSVHAYRLLRLYEELEGARFPGKISGAVGTYAALVEVLGPRTEEALRGLVERLGLDPWPLTKQTLPHDAVSGYLQRLSTLCMALVELARDLWLLSMLGYIVVKRVGVGSSTMPHKVNPIEVENAEGNLELAASLLMFLSSRLVATRLQRDLSDSTLRRNYGTATAYLLVGLKNLHSFLGRIGFDAGRMARDLEEHPEALSEAVQIRLRLRGHDALEEVRRIVSRGEGYLEELERAVRGLGADPAEIIPKRHEEYLGMASSLAERVYRLCAEKLGKKK